MKEDEHPKMVSKVRVPFKSTRINIFWYYTSNAEFVVCILQEKSAGSVTLLKMISRETIFGILYHKRSQNGKRTEDGVLHEKLTCSHDIFGNRSAGREAFRVLLERLRVPDQ